MSKAIGSVLGTNVKANTSPAQNYLDYLKTLNTSYADNATNAMGAEAERLANGLESLPEWQMSVDASDAAAQRAENAVYQSYVDKLSPLHAKQTQDLETRLANQGLSVGSEAYQRAMADLQSSQNNALNQAAYQSVSAGQNAFNQSFSNALSAANFTNNARQNYINSIYNLLQNAPTEYEKQMNIYATQTAMAAQKAQAKQQSFNNTVGALSSVIQTGGFLYGL